MTAFDTITAKTRPCVVCSERSVLTVDADAYRQWLHGELIHKAFPDMTADRRELLISGTHPACWDSMFEGDDQ